VTAAARDDVLRAEHDELARRLACRPSIDEARRASYSGFAAFVAAGVTGKLAFDRWFAPFPKRDGAPVFFFAALVVAAVLVALTATWALRARRHMRGEDAAFARLRELRDALGLDP
jgi:hypothetical protein